MNNLCEKGEFFQDRYIDKIYLVIFKVDEDNKEQFMKDESYSLCNLKFISDLNITSDSYGWECKFYYYCKLFFDLSNVEKLMKKTFKEQNYFFNGDDKYSQSVRIYKVGDKTPVGIKTREYIAKEDYLEIEDI